MAQTVRGKCAPHPGIVSLGSSQLCSSNLVATQRSRSCWLISSMSAGMVPALAWRSTVSHSAISETAPTLLEGSRGCLRFFVACGLAVWMPTVMNRLARYKAGLPWRARARASAASITARLRSASAPVAPCVWAGKSASLAVALSTRRVSFSTSSRCIRMT